jgi:class 3 adenylate cyclase
VFRSIVAKNLLLCLAILLVAIVPLALRYDMDSREYEIQTLASKLEVFAERGAAWLDVDEVAQVETKADRDSDAYRSVLDTLKRIEREFEVDNAVLLRRQPNGMYAYIAAGHDGFDPGQPADIHRLFPATYTATEDTWQAGQMMHSELFGGTAAGTDYDQFLQINMPLKQGDEVVAILMLNKFANPVAAAVRMKTMTVVMLSAVLFAAGLVLFGVVSARMLKPLRTLTVAAGQVSEGRLDVTVPPARTRDEVGRLTAAFAGMIDGLRQRDFIRDTFGRYVAKEVVDELLGSPDGLRLGGESRVITILVTDLRGFTALAAALPPKAVLEILNRYLARMVAVIGKHRGTVDEIQGDGILAFFGAPLAGADDPVRAVACAVEMQQALEAFNAEQRAAGRPEVGMGIGINTGEVIVGNIGSEQRTKYGAVGSAINMAYRIESYTVGGQILLSPVTWERVRDVVRVRGTVRAEFKGLDRPLTLYDVAAVGGEYALSLPERPDDRLVPLDSPLPVVCHAIEGKTVATTGVSGAMTRLAAGGADLALDPRPSPHANVKLVLSGDGGEIYAKVAATPAEKPDEVRVVFTSVSGAARQRLDAVRSSV